MSIDSLRSLANTSFANDFYRKILNVSESKLKRFYLSMEFNKINNPEFKDPIYYPLKWMTPNGRTSIFTPQINNISFMMPFSPPLFTWDQLPKVNNHNNR